ncbi:unnamed protein product [Amoebophrya sp. A25]|nr:unnamed protein product [Amoebophrya sp. A25]|eukprot:GSA25T00019195001.1
MKFEPLPVNVKLATLSAREEPVRAVSLSLFDGKISDRVLRLTMEKEKPQELISHKRQISAFRLSELDTVTSLENSTLLLPPEKRKPALKYVQPYIYPCDEPGPTKGAFATCKNRTDQLLTRFNQSITGSEERETSKQNQYHVPVLITTMSYLAEQQRPFFPSEKQIQIFCPLLNFVHNPEKHCDDYPEYTFTNQRRTYNVTTSNKDGADSGVIFASTGTGEKYVISRQGAQQRQNMEQNQTLYWYISCMSHGCDMDLPENRHSRGCIGLPCRSSWPSFMVDTLFERNRKLQVLAYLYDVRGELYWEVDQFNSTTDLLHFGGNGDGQLIYPGVVDTSDDEGPGLETDDESCESENSSSSSTSSVPLASIRLKHIRDGLEDLEYLYLLEDALVSSVVGAADLLSESDTIKKVNDVRAHAKDFIVEKFVHKFVTSTVDTVAQNGTWLEERRKVGEAIANVTVLASGNHRDVERPVRRRILEKDKREDGAITLLEEFLTFMRRSRGSSAALDDTGFSRSVKKINAHQEQENKAIYA